MNERDMNNTSLCMLGEDGEYLELVSKINYTNYDGEVVNLEDKIIIVDSTGISTGWIATQEEILAEDWIMAE